MMVKNINLQVIPERLSEWVTSESAKLGSWGKLSKAISTANHKSEMRITTQGLLDWKNQKSETINPRKFQGVINYLKVNYPTETVNQILEWLYGNPVDGIDFESHNPELIVRISNSSTIEEWLEIADSEVLPALQALIRRVPELAKKPQTEQDVSISKFIQSKIKQQNMTIEQGVQEIYDWYPRKTKTSLDRLSEIIKGHVLPDLESEIQELVNALSQFCDESISVDDLTDPGGIVFRIDEA